MATTGHETEAINVQGLKASLKKGGNIGIYNEAICSTAGGTAAKVTNTTPPSFTLTAGAKILVKFTYAISAENATLQVGSNSAKPIYYKGSALPADLVIAGTSVFLQYDGTSFNIVGDLNTDTTYSTMGASGSTHASGLVPDTPSTAGTTKFLREDGTWQEPAGQNYSAGDGIDISNNEISADNTIARKTDLAPAKLGSGIGTCSTSSGTALEVVLSDYNLVQNGIVAVTFENDVPANATLNINSKGAKPIYYKGSAIKADVIKADDTVTFGYDGTNYVVTSLGGGGGSSVDSNITVSLVPVVSGSQYAASLLNGVTVELWNVSDNKTVETKTWAGSQLSFTKIMAAKTYKLKYSQKYGYATPQDSQEFVLGVGETYAVGTVEYQADKYVLNVSTNQEDHSDLSATVIRVSATGISADGYLDFTGSQTDVEVLAPKGTTPTAACSSGQPSANNYKQTITVVAATNPSGSTPTTGSITALYETEILTVSITKDSGSGNMSTPTITVKNGNTTIGTLHNGDSLKVAYSINYVCTASDLDGYSAPASVTKNWANTTAKSLSFLYEEETGLVDLGLPSGTKWAIGNIIKVGSKYKIGAETDYVAYVSFGNVTPHFSANGSTFDDGYDWGTANTGPYASTPGAAISGAQTTGASYAANSGYDAARQLLGGKWRMPTAAECKELNDNCTSAWVTKNGVAGREFTSNINGAKIFFPAAGYGYGSSLRNRGSGGCYWSSSLYSADYGYYLYVNSSGVNPQNNSGRYFGLAVRAVQ